MTELTRHEVRYWLFRFRTAETGGASAEGAPLGLRERFEGHPHFSGWSSFGVTWDVAEDPFVLVPLRHSLEEQWNSQAWAAARPMPGDEG
jgi:hypothetical protein